MANTGATNAQSQIESLDEFKSDKKGKYERWAAEFNAADDAIRKFHTRGNKTVARYRNDDTTTTARTFNLNIFHSNITTMQAMMFGKLPEISFDRTNMDFNDDPARVAGMMLQRMLSADIGTPNDQYSQALRQNLQDRLLPGLGVSRVRYEFDEDEVEIAEVYDQQSGALLEEARTETQVSDERAPIDYVHWRDLSWSPCRTWQEMRWVAFRTLLTRDQLVKRFGEKVGNAIPLSVSQESKEEEVSTIEANTKQDAFKRAEIWEIWNKSDRKVYWWCKEWQFLLDEQEDPLQLTGFFPIPEPMTANLTTTTYMPIPDFVMGQDLYNEIDKLETRISLITEAVKVVGVYDQAAEGVKRMMTEGTENDLIPVDNWAMFAEKGGLQGSIDWMPIEEIASVLEKLIARRNDAKALLYEITGISDIMRGAQAAGGAVTATERSLEARFASVRIQAMQDVFAKYATDLIRLRAEIISKHFSPKSIVEQSNIMNTPDVELVEPALELIKNDSRLVWRIQVKPESVAMVDYAQLKEERTAYIVGLATYMQSAAPVIEMAPGALPLVLEMLKWGMAGFKGSNEIEGVLDQAIRTAEEEQKAAAEQPQQEEPPSPEEIKLQIEQLQSQQQESKQQHDMQIEQMKHQNKMQQLQMEAQMRTAELQLETQSSLTTESAQAELNMQEQEHETDEAIRQKRAETAMQKDIQTHAANQAESRDDD